MNVFSICTLGRTILSEEQFDLSNVNLWITGEAQSSACF